jgi:hypothetical protein
MSKSLKSQVPMMTLGTVTGPMCGNVQYWGGGRGWKWAWKMRDVKGLIFILWQALRKKATGKHRRFKKQGSNKFETVHVKIAIQNPTVCERHCLFFQLPASLWKLGRSIFYRKVLTGDYSMIHLKGSLKENRGTSHPAFLIAHLLLLWVR